MSYQSLPSQNPSVQAGGKPGIPGTIGTTRQPNAMASKNLMRLLGQGLYLFGQELMKERPDPAAMARAKAMISQAQAAKMGMIQSQQNNMASSAGRPRPPDGAVDPLTGSPGGGGVGMSQYGAK